MSDKISVIMSVYKENKMELKSSIESILNQTYSNLEFIIIIDYPEEKWRINFIEEYRKRDGRIKLIVNSHNIGLPLSLNEGLKYATGQYIARMDADDISYKMRLEKQIYFIKENNYDICGSDIQCFYNNKKQQYVDYCQNTKYINKLLKEKNSVAHPTWFAKKTVFEKLNGYRNIFSCEDYDFLLRCSLGNFKIGNLDECLLLYRLNETSISRANSGKQETIAEYLRENYKNNKIADLNELENYMNSLIFEKRLKNSEKYCNLKNIRAKYRANKFPKFYIYTLLLILSFGNSIPEIRKKLINKVILLLDSRSKNNEEINNQN